MAKQPMEAAQILMIWRMQIICNSHTPGYNKTSTLANAITTAYCTTNTQGITSNVRTDSGICQNSYVLANILTANWYVDRSILDSTLFILHEIIQRSSHMTHFKIFPIPHFPSLIFAYVVRMTPIRNAGGQAVYVGWSVGVRLILCSNDRFLRTYSWGMRSLMISSQQALDVLLDLLRCSWRSVPGQHPINISNWTINVKKDWKMKQINN